MDKLVGKTVKQVFVNEGEDRMAFITDQGTICFVVDGDCCSTSWFADLVGFQALIGAQVEKHEEIPLPDWVNVEDGRGRQAEDSAYGHRLTTSKGYCDIVFRNSSNGYYGGSIDDGSFADTVSGMKEITEDWNA